MVKTPEEGDKETTAQKNRTFYKYFSAGMQLVAPVIGGVLVGLWLDDHFNKEKPVYTIILSSVMIVVALYQFIKQYLKN